MRAISLFSGLGGLDVGAALAGIRTTLALDHDGDALDALRRNLGVPTITCDLSTASLPDDVDIDDVDIVFGGPPCTPFSHAGFWLDYKRKGEGGRGELVNAFWKITKAIQPRAFVMENVPGLTFKTHQVVLDRLRGDASTGGYAISVFQLNAADCGVPQARRRVFVVGVRDKQAFHFKLAPIAKVRGAAWAFGGLQRDINPPEADEEFTGKYRSLLPQVPTGDNYLYFTKRRGHETPKFKWRSKYWSFLLKLDPNMPSSTVPATRVTNNGPFHWENRHLRVAELKRLQGLPADYETNLDLTTARRHVGNAVPPLLGGEVLWQVRAYLNDLEPEARPEHLGRARDGRVAADTVDSVLWQAIDEATESDQGPERES